MQVTQLLLAQIQTFGAQLMFQVLAVLGLGVAWLSALAPWWSASAQQELALLFWRRLSVALARTAGVLGVLWLSLLALAWPALPARVGGVLGPVLAGIFVLSFWGHALIRWAFQIRQSALSHWIWLLLTVIYTLLMLLVIVAQSWMRSPAGVELIDGRFQITNWSEVFLNPDFVTNLLVTLVCAAIVAAAFFLAINAWLIKNRSPYAFAVVQQKWVAGIGLVASVALLILMDTIARLWGANDPAMPSLLNAQVKSQWAVLGARILFVAFAICLAGFVASLASQQEPGKSRWSWLMSVSLVSALVLWILVWCLMDRSKGAELVAGLPIVDLVSRQPKSILWLGLSLVLLTGLATMGFLWRRFNGVVDQEASL